MPRRSMESASSNVNRDAHEESEALKLIGGSFGFLLAHCQIAALKQSPRMVIRGLRSWRAVSLRGEARIASKISEEKLDGPKPRRHRDERRCGRSRPPAKLLVLWLRCPVA